MQTIFSVPMRTNNNNEYLADNLRLGDFINFDLYDNIRCKISVEQCNPGNTIPVQFSLWDGARRLMHYAFEIAEPRDVYFGFTTGEVTSDTLVNASIQTNGQARYSIDIVTLEAGESFPGEPEFNP